MLYSPIPLDESVLMDGESYTLLRHYDKAMRGRNGRNRATYYITDYGRVLKMTPQDVRDPCPARVMKLTPSTHKCGYYYQVRLPDATCHIHRLVGEAFLPEFESHLMVCHINEELPAEQINRVDNLFIGTHSDNMFDAYAKGRKTWSNQTYKHLQ